MSVAEDVHGPAAGARQRVLYLTGAEQVELREMPVPVPGPAEVLLRIDGATTCGTDLKVWRRGGHPRMLRVPCAFGHEMAGTVAAVGGRVVGWREGDPVVLANSASCGGCPPCRAGRENLCQDLRYVNGAFAEYLLVPERFVLRSLHHRPPGLAATTAAVTEPLACVLHGLEGMRLDPGREVAVLGAGPIGLLFVVELVRRGHPVTVSDVEVARLEVAVRMGATSVIRAQADGEDAEQLRSAATGQAGFPLVIEATGLPAAWTDAVAAVAVGGTVVLFGGCAPGTSVSLDTHRLHYSEITVRGAYHHRPATFAAAVERLAEGHLDVSPLLQTQVTLEGVDDALRRMGRREILKASVLPRAVQRGPYVDSE